MTHDQEEALSLADRILVMIDGQTRQIGTPEELYARPAHADVAEFMGYRNLVPSPAEAADGGRSPSTVGGARVCGHADGGGRRAARCGDPPGRSARRRGDGPIAATVEIAEYHGRDFYAVARGRRTARSCIFRSDARVAAGEAVRLWPRRASACLVVSPQ